MLEVLRTLFFKEFLNIIIKLQHGKHSICTSNYYFHIKPSIANQET